jgi:hypothetical protein
MDSLYFVYNKNQGDSIMQVPVNATVSYSVSIVDVGGITIINPSNPTYVVQFSWLDSNKNIIRSSVNRYPQDQIATSLGSSSGILASISSLFPILGKNPTIIIRFNNSSAGTTVTVTTGSTQIVNSQNSTIYTTLTDANLAAANLSKASIMAAVATLATALTAS